MGRLRTFSLAYRQDEMCPSVMMFLGICQDVSLKLKSSRAHNMTSYGSKHFADLQHHCPKHQYFSLQPRTSILRH